MLQVVIWGYEEICLILYFVCCHYVDYFMYVIIKVQYLICICHYGFTDYF